MAKEEDKVKNPTVTKVQSALPPLADQPLPEPVSQDEIQVLFQLLRTVKRPLTAAPTNTPKNFLQMFEVYDTGGVRRLYIFVGTTWRYVVLT